MTSLQEFINEKLILKRKMPEFFPKTKKELIRLLNDFIDNEDYNFWKIDVSEITDLSNLFGAVSTIDRDIDLSDWDVSNVVYLEGTFMGLENFTGKSIENWDVKNVTSMLSTFNGCKKLNCDFSSWDIKNVKNMSRMFNDCIEFVGNGLDEWDVSKCDDFSQMFKGCKKLDTNVISDWTINDDAFTKGMLTNAGPNYKP